MCIRKKSVSILHVGEEKSAQFSALMEEAHASDELRESRIERSEKNFKEATTRRAQQINFIHINDLLLLAMFFFGSQIFFLFFTFAILSLHPFFLWVDGR